MANMLLHAHVIHYYVFEPVQHKVGLHGYRAILHTQQTGYNGAILHTQLHIFNPPLEYSLESTMYRKT